MAFAILPGVDIFSWNKKEHTNMHTLKQVCTHCHGNVLIYQEDTFWQTQYAVFHVRCGTDDDENNNTNNKKDGLVVVCYISSIIISSPFASGGISSFTWLW